MIGKGVIDHDVVVCSRLCLARNLADYPFVCTCSVEQLEEIQALVNKRLKGELEFKSVGFGEQSDLIQQQLLAELAAVSQCDTAGQYASEGTGADSLGASAMEATSSIKVNDDDHFRILVTRTDGDLMAAWQTASKLDDLIEERFPIAFSQKWGYLTTSPADLGTAMRVSMTVFLPGLVATQQTEKLFRSLQQKNLIARSALAPESSLETTVPVVGQPVDLFQISNLNTLGVSEVELIRQIEEALPPIVNLEREARAIVLAEPQSIIRMQVDDAVQQLCLMALEGKENQEKVLISQLLSRVRYGVSTGLVSGDEVSRVLQCFSLASKRTELSSAVLNEQYAEAATIRDHIRLLEQQLGQSDTEEFGQ